MPIVSPLLLAAALLATLFHARLVRREARPRPAVIHVRRSAA